MPIDTDALARWIQPQHLSEDTLANYRDAMAADPARLVQLHDVLVPDVAARLGAYLANDADWNVEHGLYSDEGGVDASSWEAAPEEDRFFRFGKLEGTRPDAMLNETTLTYMQWRAFVSRPPLHGFFEAMTGLSLGPSDDFGVHRFEVGDFLREHDDDNKDRRVALVIYLTPEWTSECGGALFMQDPAGQTRRVEATFNSMVVFDTQAGTQHHVGVVEPAAGDGARYTFGGWFPNPS